MTHWLGMTQKQVKAMVNESFPELQKEHGYRWRKGSLINISGHVLRSIGFGGSDGHHWVRVAASLQFLIIPTEFMGMTVGKYLQPSNDSIGRCGWFHFDTLEEAMASVKDMGLKLEQIALPFLQESRSIEAVAEDAYQKKWAAFWGDSVSINYDRCFIYAYTGKHEAFMSTFQTLKDIYEKEDRDWAIAKYKRLLEIKDNLYNKDALKTIFDRHVQYSIEKMQLAKYIS